MNNRKALNEGPLFGCSSSTVTGLETVYQDLHSLPHTFWKGFSFIGLETLWIHDIKSYEQPQSIKRSYFVWKVYRAQWSTRKLYIGIYIYYHTCFRREVVLWDSKHSQYGISSHMNNRKALKEVTLFGRCIKHSDQLGNIISGSTFVTTHLLDGVWFHGARNTLNTVYQVIWTTIKQ